ncbi:MAG: hypothetical protein V1912_05115 [bacterium]
MLEDEREEFDENRIENPLGRDGVAGGGAVEARQMGGGPPLISGRKVVAQGIVDPARIGARAG